MAEIAYEALKDEAYYNFITAAVRRSDLFAYTVNWPSDEAVFPCATEFFKRGYSEAFYEYCYQSFKDEHAESRLIFEENGLPFLTSLEPFHADGQKLSKTKSVYYLRATAEVIPLLFKPKSLENWVFPQYPENLCFITDNRIWFTCEEKYGQKRAFLFADSEEDHRFWTKKGIIFIKRFSYADDVENRPFASVITPQ